MRRVPFLGSIGPNDAIPKDTNGWRHFNPLNQCWYILIGCCGRKLISFHNIVRLSFRDRDANTRTSEFHRCISFPVRFWFARLVHISMSYNVCNCTNCCCCRCVESGAHFDVFLCVSHVVVEMGVIDSKKFRFEVGSSKLEFLSRNKKK